MAPIRESLHITMPKRTREPQPGATPFGQQRLEGQVEIHAYVGSSSLKYAYAHARCDTAFETNK